MRYLYLLIILVTAFTTPLSNIALAQEGEEGKVYTIKEYLEDVFRSDLSKPVIVLNEATGLLTVRATPSQQARIEELISLWDVGPKQICIEARFVEISLATTSQLGIEWAGEYQYRKDGRRASRGKGDLYIGRGYETGGEEGTSIYTPPYSGTDFGLGPSGIGGGLGLTIGKTKLSGNQLSFTLRALEHSKKATLLSSPRVTTLSGQMANIQVVTRNPYVVDVERTNTGTTGNPMWEETYDIAEKLTGITLEVTPRVGAEGKIITLDIHPEVSFVKDRINVSTNAPANLGWPVIDRRSTMTSVIVRSGETVVLGGLIKDDESRTVRKVPILGSLPILGKVFRREDKSRDKKNLIIFLTATMITPEGKPVQ